MYIKMNVCPYYHGNQPREEIECKVLYIIDRMFVCLCVCPLVVMVTIGFEAIIIIIIGCREIG